MDHQVVKRQGKREIDFVYDDITVVLGEIEIMFCKIYFEIFPRRTRSE